MRSKLPIILLLVIVIVVGVVAFVLVGNPPADQGQQQQTDGGDGSPQPTQVLATELPTITPIPYVEIVIAVQDIPRGVAIEPNMVALVPYPEEVAPLSAFTNIEDAIGMIARVDIFREQPVLQGLVVPDLANLGNVGSDAAAVLPSNRVGVALPMDRLTSVAYAIQPGDRVDVIVSFLFVDVDRNFQSVEPNAFQLINTLCAIPTEQWPNCSTGFTIQPSGESVRGAFDTRLVDGVPWPVLISPSEQPRPRLATQRTITDALVIWTGDFPIDGIMFRPPATPTPVPTPTQPGDEPAAQQAAPPPPTVPPRPDIVTLAVAPQDAVVITWLVEARIPMTFALRSASAQSLVQTDTVSLQYIMERFSISVPDKFEYNFEPAIRSIRQLSVGNTISLQNSGG